MSLFEQFQVFAGSILFGALLLFSWSLFNRIFYSKKIKWIRIFFEIPFFLLQFFLYYRFLCAFAYGAMNVFYVVGILIGAYVYYRYYAYSFDVLFENGADVLQKHLLMPIRLYFKRRSSILKKRREERKRKRHEKKQNSASPV